MNGTIQVTPGDPPPGFCTFVVHNIGWVGFIAGSVDLTFNVEVFPCTLGNSIELGIYEAPNCMNSHLVGTCNTEMIEGNTYSFNNTEPLNPGCVYFLVFDNNGPAECPFEVTVTSGSATAPNPGPTPTPEGPTDICPGGTATYSIPPVFGTCEYNWTGPPGSMINGQASPYSIQGDAGASVEITFGNTAGNVCVETGNACAGYSSACLPVTLTALPPTNLPPTSICHNTSLVWIDGNTYNTTQMMSTTFSSWLGCDSVVNQQLIVRPAITTNLGTFLRCPDQCVEVGGTQFCTPGFFQVVLPSYLDCDSTVIFTINQSPVEAVVAIPDTLNCLQNSVLLDGTPSTNNANYSWFNAQNMLLETKDTLRVSTPGTYLLVVERVVGTLSCRDSAWTTVVGNLLLPPVSAEGDTINCQGDSLQINGSSPLPGTIFSWSGPGIDSTNQHLEDPWVNLSGTYVLTAVNPANGCAAKDTTTVASIGLTPDLSVPVKDTVNCSDPVVWLVAQSGTPGTTFSWMAPDSTFSFADSVRATQNGLWIVLATAPGGCTNLDTTQVLLDTLPPLAAASGGTLDCSGTPISIQGSSPDSTATFSWTGPGNFSANLADTLVSLSGSYILTVTTPNGCTASATATVLANTNVPNLSANGNETLTCSKTSVNLTANSNSPGAVITWSGPGGFSAMGNFTSTSLPGLYTATATTPNGCQASLNLVVPIDTTAPVVTAQGDTIRCNNPQAFLFGYCTDIGAIYSWSGPGIGANNQFQQNPVVNQPGAYDLIVTSSVNGCTAYVQTIAGFDIALPQLSTAQPSTLTCTNTSEILWGSSLDNGVSFLWSGPNGFTNTNDSIQVNTPGNYTITATGLNGCQRTQLLVVPANTTPPDLTASGGLINCVQTSVQLIGQSLTPGVTFLWTGPNGFSSTNQSPTTTETGNFQLLGTAPNGCTSLAFAQVSTDLTVPTLSTSSTVQTLNCKDTLTILQAQSNLAGTGFEWSFMGMPVGNNASFTAEMPGVYSVTGTAPNGCLATSSIFIQEDIVPPNAFAQGDTLFCNNPNVVISGGSNTPGTSLLWSGPGNFSSTQTMPSVSLTGTYTLTVTAPNGCTATANADVLPDEAAPDLSIQPVATLTCASPMSTLFATSTTPGVVFNWTGPGNFVASGSSVQTQIAGLYTVQAIGPNGCSNLQSITLAIDTIRPVATVSGGTLSCLNTSLTLSGSSNTSGVSYQWAGPNNFSSTISNPSTNQPGLYLLTLTAPNGCMGTAAIQILQDTLAPNIMLNGNTTLTCTQTSTSLSANSADPGGIQWFWTGPGNFSASSSIITVNVAGNYMAVATAQNGCTASAALVVNQDVTLPTAQATGGILNCFSPGITLSGQSNDANASFQWAGPGPFNASGSMPATSMPGIYTLTVTGGNGCTATAVATVTSDQLPPPFTLAANTITCSVPAVTASASMFPFGTTFNWMSPGGLQLSGSIITVSIPGLYQVIAQGANGCTATKTLTINADQQLPLLILEAGVLSCRDSVVQILAKVEPAGAVLSWSGPQQNLPPTEEISVTNAGLYTLLATAANGCTAESNVMVEEITPNWSVQLGPDQTVWEGADVHIKADLNLQNQDVFGINWMPAYSCPHCLQQSFRARDSVYLTITVEDKFGCLMTDGIQINVRKRGAIYVPNVFSPDGDGNNDEFQVFAGNPATLVRSLQIFDRWGSMVFQEENFHPNESKGRWNGTHRGILLRPAVFVWTLEVEYEDGTTELLSGDLLLKL